MSILALTIITLSVLLVMIAVGFHLGLALISSGIIGVYLAMGNLDIALKIMTGTAFSALRDYIFGVTPLFILMGLLANLSGSSSELYSSTHQSLRRLKGSLGYATVIANAIFAAMTGVSIASAAVFTKIAVPQMRKHGYDKKFTVGTVAGSSILGMLIPPSVLMIIYGTVSGSSVGKLFIGGVIPGLILTAIFIGVIKFMITIKPNLVPEVEEADRLTTKERLTIIARPWPMICLIIISLGGIWMGFFTPTEAGGIAAFGALLLVILKKRFSVKGFWGVLLNAGVSTGSVMFLLISAQMYSRALATCGAINLIESLILSIDLPPILIVIMFEIIFIALGCVLDSTSIVLLCMPIMCPIVTSFGYDLTWFGIVSIVSIQIGIITPPFGLSVFTIKSALGDVGSDEGNDISIQDIFAGAFPYIFGMLVLLIIVIAFPQTVTALL